MKRRSAFFFIILNCLCLFSAEAIHKGVTFVNPPTATLKTVETVNQINILSNLHVPKGIVIAALSDNLGFISDFYSIIYQINDVERLIRRDFGQHQHIDLIAIGSNQYKFKLQNAIRKRISKKDALKYFKFVEGDVYGDRWMQDWGEFAAIGTSAEGTIEHGLYYVNRNRGLKGIVKKLAVILDLPFITSDSYSASDGNYGGNLESTPDGVTFHGDNMNEAQVTQLMGLSGPGTHFAQLFTDWLSVGHVDEMFAVIPSNHHSQYPLEFQGNKVNYSIVVADPLLALKAIINYQGEQESIYDGKTVFQLDKLKEIARYFLEAGGKLNQCYLKFPWERDYCRFVDRNIFVYNNYILPNIVTLTQTTPTTNDDFIHVPQLYQRASFLPGTTNMVVLRNHLIIPDPLFDGFRNIIQTRLAKKIGGTDKIHFINDEYEYHRLLGEVHCGTNTMREFNFIFSLEADDSDDNFSNEIIIPAKLTQQEPFEKEMTISDWKWNIDSPTIQLLSGTIKIDGIIYSDRYSSQEHQFKAIITLDHQEIEKTIYITNGPRMNNDFSLSIKDLNLIPYFFKNQQIDIEISFQGDTLLTLTQQFENIVTNENLLYFYQNLVYQHYIYKHDKLSQLESIREEICDRNFLETISGKKSFDKYADAPQQTILGQLVELKKLLSYSSTTKDEFRLLADKLSPAAKNLDQFLFWGKRVSYNNLLKQLR